MKKRIVSFLISLVMLVGLFPQNAVYAGAISADEMRTKLTQLQNQYPNGSIWKQGYWFSSGNKNNGAGFDGCWQCYGFARLVYRTLFNESEGTSYLHRNIDNLCVGDHIRFNVKSGVDHSILVTNIIGNNVYYVDCNGTDQNGRNWVHCKVRWDKYYTKSQIKNLISKKLDATARASYGYISTQKDNWVKTLNPVTIPSMPTAVNVSSTELAVGSSITASWDGVTGAESYIVSLNCSTNSSYNKTTTVTATKASFVLNDAGTYTISISAKNSAGSSSAKTSSSFTVNKNVTVRFEDYDDTLIGSPIEVVWNGTAKAPAAPSREGYTFQGWNKGLTNIKKDTTITATYEINTYTVKFVDNEGNTISSQRIKYNESAAAPEVTYIPAGYKFVGWDKEDYKCVKKDLTITAVFAWENTDLPIIASIVSAKRNTDASGYDLKVNLKNYPDSATKGKIIATLKTEAGKMVASEVVTFNLSASSSKDEEIFIDYSGVATKTEVSVVGVIDDGNTGVPIAETVETVVDLGLEWSDWSEEKPPAGDYITESRTEYRYKDKETSTSSSKAMTGWILYDSKITSWGNWSGWSNTAVSGSTTRQVETQTIPATYKTVHKYSRYVNSTQMWSHWSYGASSCYTYQEITRDTALNKIWDSSNNRYRYGADATYGTYLQNYWWNYWTAQVQTAAAYTQYRYRDAIYTYYFYKWSDWSDWLTEAVTANDNRQVEQRTTYRFKSNDIKVTAYNYKRYKYQNLNTGNYYYTYTSAYADSMGYPGEWEYKKTYSELSSITMVDDNVTLYNGYSEESWYSAEVNSQGTVTEYITYDTLEDTSGNTYVVSGSVNAPSKKATLMVFKGTNTDPTASQLEYVEQITLGENGEYSFEINPKEIPSLKTGDFNIVMGIEGGTAPIYIDTIDAPRPIYTVEFVDDDGRVIDTQMIVEGDSAVLPENNPEKEGHYFIGWDTGITNVHCDLTITAQYKKKEYTIVFVDWENNDIDILAFEHGDVLEGPEALEKTGSTFIGWDAVLDGTTTVMENMIISAVYELNTYTINFADSSGNIISSQTVEYGDEVPLPEEEPELEGMVFAGWDNFQLLMYASEDATVYPIYEYEATAAIPTASVVSGTYSGIQKIDLSTETASAKIYYAYLSDVEDFYQGVLSEEELEWFEYSEPIEISSSTALVFYASADNMNDSAYQVEEYTIIGKFDTEITGSTLSESGGKIGGKVYYNIIGEGNSAKAIPILTIYDNSGELVFFRNGETATWNVGDNVGNISNISFEKSIAPYRIKLFLWESMETIRPISSVGTFNYN